MEILQNLTEIRHSQIEKVKLLGEVHLQTLKAKIDAATEKCNNILGKEAIQESVSLIIMIIDFSHCNREGGGTLTLQIITSKLNLLLLKLFQLMQLFKIFFSSISFCLCLYFITIFFF